MFSRFARNPNLRRFVLLKNTNLRMIFTQRNREIYENTNILDSLQKIQCYVFFLIRTDNIEFYNKFKIKKG